MPIHRLILSTALVLAAAACTTAPAEPPEPGLRSLKTARGAYAYIDDPAGPSEGAPRALAQTSAAAPAGRAVLFRAPLCPPKRNDGVTFDGCLRAVAKTSFITAPVQDFPSVVALRRSLPTDYAIRAKRPPISSDANSQRVPEERRNVRVRALLFAAKKE